MNEGLKRKVKLKFLRSDRPIPILSNAAPLELKTLRCFDFCFDIIQINYTSVLAFANDVYLILLFMSRYNHAAFKQTTYILF
jgi:hypothetical protein